MIRSRWGYHPCTYPTYCKLKLLHRVYQRAVHLAYAWRRWQGKDPHNRVLRRRLRNERGQTVCYAPPLPCPEPELCPLFTHKVLRRRHMDKRGNYSREGFLEEQVVTEDWGVLGDYALARRPAPNAASVCPLRLTEEAIDALWEQANRWLEGQGVK